MPRGFAPSKVDGNHKAVIEQVRAAGYYAESTAMIGNGFPDAVTVSSRGITLMVEIKMPGETLTPKEVIWHSKFPGKKMIAYTAEDVIRELDFLDRLHT